MRENWEKGPSLPYISGIGVGMEQEEEEEEERAVADNRERKSVEHGKRQERNR